MSQSRYMWQTIQVAPHVQLSDNHSHQVMPYGVDRPEGYLLHSWHPSAFQHGAVIVCWVREPAMGGSVLAQVPAEWVGPTLEWIKRWIFKT